ncbi:Rpn family recombination-promoting nuclease/putative transposase [Bacteroides sp. 519]|uniref:Rpn family recombination-promoting nuclease/putative transposase n=1 Tax=Bacteroides sp. 519 TaxID=2302937 RepID=UPI0013D2DBF3|nr:Rpn family recombination-promoting nuclease/putative transposase [Bacteroides sp. 519]NDV59034.1 Rpn family recombination-promoting nuclease/putative transposase [Bacteroides sp. 519]
MGSEGLIEKYINPYTDFGFKKLFGTELNKDLLISFLNSLLPDGQVIKDVTYLNAEHLGTLEADRRAVFDVYCENEQGEKFLVEMQKGEQQFFKDRSIFYTTFPIREQAVKGKSWNYELKAVYTVGILNFSFDSNNNDYYHHEVRLVDVATQEVFYDKLTLIYLEMPKFNKTEYELENMFDKWMFVLRNLSRLMERPAALQERIFTRLFETAEIARFNRKELVEYEDSLKNYRDWYSVMETSEKKGLAKGLEKGREEGLAEGLAKGIEKGLAEGIEKGILEVARRMKFNSIPLHTIQDLTGLSLEEIEKLSP